MKQRSFELLLMSGIFLAYTITTGVALRLDVAGALLGGVANTIPVVIFGLGVRNIIVRLIATPLRIQLAAHVLLCAVFCTLSYCLLIVLLGLFYGAGPSGIVFRPFSVSATAWQSLENVTIYALIAALVHLQTLNVQRNGSVEAGASAPLEESPVSGVVNASKEEGFEAPANRAPDPMEPGSDAGLSRYFIKIGEELRPLDIDMVVSINGADDYAEVSTTTGKHLVRMTLASFAKSLDSSKYVRVHRSWIVNTHRVTRAESAGGGRLLLHMDTGQIISTSRDGAKLLRNRVL